jgi:hypothetical protein
VSARHDNAATCARCTPGGAGLCADHLRKRAAVIRGSARRAEGLRAYADRLATIAGHGRDHVLDDGDVITAPTVALREVL